MRRIVLAIVSTAVALVLLLSFKSHSSVSLASQPAAVSPSATSTGDSSTTNTSSSSSGSTKNATSSTTKKATVSTTKTVTGDAADTQYGPVQVQITVKAGKVTSVKATEYPYQDPRDQQINYYAIPVLNQEATSAGNASIDGVSGATYTSDGYIQSLQSALDKAGL